MKRFKEILTHYFAPNELELKATDVLAHTKNTYEFDMWLVPTTSGDWFALVEHPDIGRVDDIARTIFEEFGALTEGWCILKQYRKQLKKDLLPVESVRDDVFQYATHDTEYGPTWLLKLTNDASNPFFNKITHEKPPKLSIRSMHA